MAIVSCPQLKDKYFFEQYELHGLHLFQYETVEDLFEDIEKEERLYFIDSAYLEEIKQDFLTNKNAHFDTEEHEDYEGAEIEIYRGLKNRNLPHWEDKYFDELQKHRYVFISLDR